MKQHPLRIVLLGAQGRMGRAISEAISRNRRFTLGATVVRKSMNETDAKLKKGRVAIDFTNVKSVSTNLRAALKAKIPYVLGVTGLTPAHNRDLKRASKTIPVFRASNFSLGAAILSKAAVHVAQWAPNASIQIIETHHKNKKDAPSGTALSIGRAMGTHAKRRITFKSIRKGQVIGIHRVVFRLAGETLEVVHDAKSRRIFAEGSLAAAQFLSRKAAGMYTMENLVGVERKKHVRD